VKPQFSTVEIVRCIYDAYESGDLRAPAEHFSDDAEGYISENVPWGGFRRGRAEMREGLALLRTYIASAFEPSEFVDCGGNIVVVGNTTGFVHETGRGFSVRTVHVWHFRGGKIVRFENYVDNAMAEVMQAPAAAG
jgi:ketosteroid isomerase-like protein